MRLYELLNVQTKNTADLNVVFDVVYLDYHRPDNTLVSLYQQILIVQELLLANQ